MVALYTMFYNFIRTHSKLRMTPALAAGLTDTFMGFEAILERIVAAQAPNRAGHTVSEAWNRNGVAHIALASWRPGRYVTGTRYLTPQREATILDPRCSDAAGVVS